MTEFKGTKGKWIAERHQVVRHASSGSISPYWQQICSYSGSYPETNYNALLMSKAPEMLEMLEKLTLVFDNFRMPTEANLKTYSSEIKQLIKEATEL
jgi:hypothetical protein